VGCLSKDQLRSIAEQKMVDPTRTTLQRLEKIIAGTASLYGNHGGRIMATKFSAQRAKLLREVMEEGKFYTPNEAVGPARETGSKNSQLHHRGRPRAKVSHPLQGGNRMVRGTVILPHAEPA
jgi:hypothetical protein